MEEDLLGFWDWDLRTNALEWTDAMFVIFDVDKASFSRDYTTFREAIVPEDVPGVAAAIRRALKGEPYRYQFRRRSDGLPIQGHGVVHYEGGVPVRMAGVCFLSASTTSV